jgi:MFS family permease
MARLDARPDSRTAWVAACAALAILTIAHGAPLISAVALKHIAAELGTSRAAPAGAGSLTYVGAAVGGIAAGWLAGRIGFRPVVLFGSVMLSAGLFVSTLGGVPELYVGHGLLIGLFGVSCMLSPLVTYVSLWFDRRRGAAVALISSGQSVAGALWPIVFDYSINQSGWRQTMVLYGAFALVAIALLSVFFLYPTPQAATAGAREGAASAPAKSSHFVMIVLMVAVFCCCIPMNMPIQHIVAFCGDLGIPSQRSAAMLSVMLGSAFLARQFWGFLADRIGGLKTLLWSSLAQAIALGGLLVAENEVALLAISAAFGFGLSGLLPAYVIAIREHYPASEASWRVPTVMFAGYLGMAAGGWGAGALYDYFKIYIPAFGVGMVFNMVNLLLLLGLALWYASSRNRATMA